MRKIFTVCISNLFLFFALLALPSMKLQAQCSQWTTAPGNQCENIPAFTLTGGTPAPGVYLVNGSAAVTFDPGALGVGTHTIEYTANSCSDTVTLSIDVLSVTTASLSGLDTAYCINNNPQVITPTTAPAGGTLIGPGVTSGQFNIGNAGVGNHTIKYYFTNTNSCTDTASTDVNVRALPTVTLTIPNTQRFTCEFDGPFSITGHNPVASWQQGVFTGNGVDSVLGTFDPDPTLLGWNVINYRYNDGLCVNNAVDSILVNSNPVVTPTPFPKMCANDLPLALNGDFMSPYDNTNSTYSGPGVSGFPGNWQFDPGAVTPGASYPIEYCYTGPNGCETCITQNIEVIDIIPINWSTFQACENEGPVDLTTKVTPTNFNYVFTGTGVQLSDSITWKPIQAGAGSHTLTAFGTDSNGCVSSAQQTVTVNPTPSITLSSITPAHTLNPDDANILIKLCEGDTAITTATSTPFATFIYNPQTFADFNTPGQAKFAPVGVEEFSYLVRGIGTSVGSTGENCEDTGTIVIDVILPAVAQIDGEEVICSGDTTVLVASGANNYEWVSEPGSPTTASLVVAPKARTEYQVIAKSDEDGDGNQCSQDTATFEVDVQPLPIIKTRLDTVLFFGDEAQLSATGGSTYVWAEGVLGELSCYECPDPIATPVYESSANPEFRTYQVTGTDSNGCVNIDSMIISLYPDIIIFVPTAFSPNGDGFNDDLKVITKGIAKIDIVIYDRSGNIVYESNNLEQGWDGTLKNEGGEPLNKGTYLYKLTASPIQRSSPIEKAGQINLMR